MADNSPDTFEIDPQLLREFLVESLESLEGLDRLFVDLESSPGDRSVIDQIFRPIHSIKGNSAFFGLLNVKNFSHTMENLLQEIRNHKRNVTQPIIDILLKGTDFLRAMLERVENGDLSTDFLPEEEAQLAEFNAVLEGEEDSLDDLANRTRHALARVAEMELPEAASTAVEEARELVKQILQIVAPSAGTRDNEPDGKAAFFVGDTEVSESISRIADFVRNVQEQSKEEAQCESFLKALAALQDVATKLDRQSILEPLAALHSDFTTIHDSGIGFDDLMASLLRERYDQIMAGIEMRESTSEKPAEQPAQPEQQPDAEAKADEAKSKPKDKPAPKSDGGGGKSLRIDEEKVDDFMNFVGELIISGEVFAYIQNKLENFPEVREVAQEFKNANLAFSELSTNLQKSLMAVRRVPIRSVMQKMPRIVRDVASINNKNIQLHIEGEDLQIDKSLVEGIENPLVHMVRNSADHGVESPEERAAAGKDEQGNVWLIAEADDETFRLTIRDDGKGLDLDAIKSKAIEKGTITQDRANHMSDQEAYLLIFGAGVSTAKKVTDVSGRGVGMDVVRSNIQALNGVIEIESELGVGTTFRIVLPMTVTLMVIDGLVARIGGSNYIIPLTDVHESVRPRSEQIFTVSGKGEMIDVRGELHHLLRTHDLLGVKTELRPEDATVVLVENNGETCGLLVDELIGQQSVVLKDLGKQFEGLQIIQGAAILGDGRVGLVFDTEGIIALQRD